VHLNLLFIIDPFIYHSLLGRPASYYHLIVDCTDRFSISIYIFILFYSIFVALKGLSHEMDFNNVDEN
jgi:hypothetical protein